MDSYQLKIFCMVTQLQSFSKAAKIMHMSQPAVSTHVKNLEEYYRGQLFERTPHGVTLTKAGDTFYVYAKRILELQDEMEQQLEAVLLRENNHMVVAASTTIGNVSLPCTIYLFKEEHPEVTIRLDIANSEEVIRKIMADEADIGVVETYTDSPDLAAIPVTSDELLLIVPMDHPRTGDTFPLKEFLHHPIILREDGSGSRKILAAALERHGYSVNDLNVIAEMSTIDAIKSAVEAGLGGAVVPKLTVRKEAYLKTLSVMQIEDLPMPLTYHIVYPAHKSMSSPVKRFIKFLTNPDENFFC